MMENRSSRPGGIDVGGVKVSRELVQFNWIGNQEEFVPGLRLFRLLAENRINIPFLCIGAADSGTLGFCCVESECFQRVEKLLEQDPPMRQNIRVIASVGTLTLFPHKCNLALLAIVLYELGNAGLPIHGIGTSLSALTFSTDYAVLNQAVHILGRILNLPSNHAPFRSEFRVQQI
jgi:hypothetical protein